VDSATDAATLSGRAQPEPGGRAALTLRATARIFTRYGSPRIIATVTTAAVMARLVVARWSWADLIAVGVLLVVQPFVEWVLHVFGLHLKPRTVLGRRFDPLFARRHRMHHRAPRETWLVFFPLPVLAGLLTVLAAISWFGFRDHVVGLTVFATTTTMVFTYEWVHYLIHTTYVPRHALYRVVWRNHILHHYKNEHYWFGVSNPAADFLLTTNPRKDAVPISPTARTLGVEDDLTLEAVPA
jgi:hypothetical protein